MNNKISFIGFDLDGTLIDSHKAVYDCLSESLPKYVNENVDNIIDIVFPLTMSQFPDYIKFKNSESFNLFSKEFINLFDTKHYKRINLIKDCFELLKYCKEKYGDENIFILTNRREKSALQVCHHLNITNIISSDKIFSTKFDDSPNPKINSLSNVMKLLKINNKLGYYVGDSPADIDSAMANKIKPIYISGKGIISDLGKISGVQYFKDLSSFLRFLKT